MKAVQKLGFIFILFFSLVMTSEVTADPFESHASYVVCFTPGMNCTQDIVQSIDGAVKNIWVQAYSFTSHPIGTALVNAKQRGVDVKIIFDKTALTNYQGALRYFAKHGIPIWIDSQPNIAHNKVLIIDQTKVVTGSFNFTRAAQQQNAENILIVDDIGLAKKYLQNWYSRQKFSKPYNIRLSPQEGNTIAYTQEVDLVSWFRGIWQSFLNWLKHLLA